MNFAESTKKIQDSAKLKSFDFAECGIKSIVSAIPNIDISAKKHLFFY
ncbi:MAG: hypothetical protein LBS50_01285 [Prevotellaceae bacterium]|nr:hypothetical protein [Prevotellaceae bacterium]